MFDRSKIYASCVVVWILYVLIVPTWTGRLYSPTEYWGIRFWKHGGEFGLKDSHGFYKVAPLWSPPSAHSTLMRASVRWPWQWPSRQAHVEISIAMIFVRWSVGLIVMGFAYRLWHWLVPTKSYNSSLSIAWAISLFLVLGWLFIFAVAAFTMGIGTTDQLLVGVLAFFGATGFLYGNRKPTSANKQTGTILPQANQPVEQVVTPQELTSLFQRNANLTKFTLGIIAGFCITALAGWITSFFRGPISGVSELGSIVYLHDHKQLNALAGLAIILLGWILGLLIAIKHFNRSFAIGLIIATTALGTTFASWR